MKNDKKKKYKRERVEREEPRKGGEERSKGVVTRRNSESREAKTGDKERVGKKRGTDERQGRGGRREGVRGVPRRSTCRDLSVCLHECACLMTDKARLALNYRCSRGEIFMKMFLSHSEIS